MVWLSHVMKRPFTNSEVTDDGEGIHIPSRTVLLVRDLFNTPREGSRMASQSSFDVVSKIETMQEMKNAVDQTTKEISQRFDFKGSKNGVDPKGKRTRTRR